jgi:hypothetical protein
MAISLALFKCRHKVTLITFKKVRRQVTTISGQRPGQFLVLRNYQNAFSVTLKAAASGTGDIVLTGNVDVVFNTFGQQLVLYVTSGLGGTRCYEVGRNF